MKVLTIAGQPVEVLALPLIFEKLRASHRSPRDEADQELLEIVKIYNYVAPEAEAAWREVLAREFAAYCEREAPR